ncbi:YhgE/Pip domain-containing protein [Paucilactobacillus kaifaensis]|uniref:YhgE/Pip domain-containing protein n=1 Tax=Paucilactobacillus kaifaensis TaxID=2559921 RepID=UPI0010F955DA|nr:YhgE/Pip domain-containing protein [Paucilactobacillus kaifaensis]
MIKGEFKFIFHNKLIMLSTIVIMIIPFLYSIFFLKSVWDPYGNTGDLPVAVVNEDQPVQYEGKTMNVGKQTVQELKKNHQLGWKFVSKEKAQSGLKNRKYYTIVTIPADFSKNATTVMSTQPKKMHLTYKTNDSLNYIGEVISDMGAKQLNTQIREQVTKAYAKAVFAQLKTVGAGMKSAAKAETQLHDGTVTLNDGLNIYAVGVNQVNDGVQTLKVSVVPLSNGISQLANGGGTLATALQTYTNGVGQVNGSVGQASSGSQLMTQKVQESASQLNEQLSSSKLNQLEQVKKALSTLATMSEEISSGSNTEINSLTDNITTIGNNTQASATQLNDIYKNVFNADDTASAAGQLSQAGTSLKDLQSVLNSDEFKQIAVTDPATAKKIVDDVNAIGTNVTNAGTKLTAGGQSLIAMKGNLTESGSALKSIQSMQTQLTSLQAQLKQVPTVLNGGSQAIDELENGLLTVQSGLNQQGNTTSTMGLLQASQTLSSGLQQIQSGTQQLANNSSAINNGAGQLSSGLGELNSKVPTLTSGVNQLADGTQQLVDNSGQLTDGATQLADGSGQLQTALVSGSKKVNSIHPTSNTANMFAAPSNLNHESYSHVSNYGHALAPYVLSVALFVGSLVFNFAYPIRKVAMLGRTPKEWFASKVTVGGIVAVGMAVIETGLMMVAGLDANHPAQMFFVAIMFSLASMYIIMFLSMTFDNPGRFVAMVLLMLQLGGSGGTFPMEITNSFFNAIHPWLPMTYSIMGFREALTSGLGSQVVWQAGGVLLIFALIGLGLLLPSMILLQKLSWHGKSQLDNNQKLQDIEK